MTENKIETLTKADIIAHLVEKFGFTRQQGRLLVDSFFDEVYDSLIEGRDVKLSGFGNFSLKEKKSRPGRNPKTGDEVEISARRVVTFKAGQKLRRKVDERQSDAPSEMAKKNKSTKSKRQTDQA